MFQLEWIMSSEHSMLSVLSVKFLKGFFTDSTLLKFKNPNVHLSFVSIRQQSRFQ